jgi:hypothetical protein
LRFVFFYFLFSDCPIQERRFKANFLKITGEISDP